jgi:hypothetical protein
VEVARSQPQPKIWMLGALACTFCGRRWGILVGASTLPEALLLLEGTVRETTEESDFQETARVSEAYERLGFEGKNGR